jgi:DNA/RNA endonuclease YhcR with UshA esterase domain
MRSSLPAGAVLALTVWAAPATPQTVIKPTDAASYVGQEVTVEGIVAQVSVSRRNESTYLNFDSPYPKQTFTGVIFRANRSAFPKAQDWQGRRVRISGKVQLYKAKPEIILERGEQVRPLD